LHKNWKTKWNIMKKIISVTTFFTKKWLENIKLNFRLCHIRHSRKWNSVRSSSHETDKKQGGSSLDIIVSNRTNQGGLKAGKGAPRRRSFDTNQTTKKTRSAEESSVKVLEMTAIVSSRDSVRQLSFCEICQLGKCRHWTLLWLTVDRQTFVHEMKRFSFLNQMTAAKPIWKWCRWILPNLLNIDLY